MISSNGSAKLSEKGLLTPDNCVVALIDHQPQMLFGVSNFDRQTIINNTVALAKATRVFDVPVVLTTVETKSFSGNLWPQIRSVFPKQEPIERSSMNSWDDKNFVAAIERTGRKKIVLCGLWTETCVALPTVQAIHDGYEVYVVEDCCLTDPGCFGGFQINAREFACEVVFEQLFIVSILQEVLVGGNGSFFAGSLLNFGACGNFGLFGLDAAICRNGYANQAAAVWQPLIRVAGCRI